MKKITILAFALLASVASFAQKWSLDKAHAKMTFTVTHLLMSEVDGVFKSFDATVTSSKEDFSNKSIDFIIASLTFCFLQKSIDFSLDLFLIICLK